VVSGLAAHVSIRQLPVTSYHEHAPQLPGVSLDTALAETRAQCPRGIPRESGRQEFDATAPQPRSAIGAELRIHQERAIQRMILSKSCGKPGCSVSYDDELGSPSAYGIDPVAQLRDLLAAEQSAEVADEHQHDGAFFPVRAEPPGFAAPVRKLDVGQSPDDPHL
jgi:hypothetical protein